MVFEGTIRRSMLPILTDAEGEKDGSFVLVRSHRDGGMSLRMSKSACPYIGCSGLCCSTRSYHT